MSDKALAICRESKLLRTNYFVRSSGRYCADISITDPITGLVRKKSVSSIDADKCTAKAAAAERELYSLIRDNFLRVHLKVHDITLQYYLSLDLECMQEHQWLRSYGGKEYTALMQYADKLDVSLTNCTTADDLVIPLQDLNLSQNTQTKVLRMLCDIFDELKKLQLYPGANPLANYCAASRAGKEESTSLSVNQALTPREIARLVAEYDAHHMRDARYLAAKLYAVGLPADIIAALDFGDIITVEGVHSLLVKEEMRPANKRQVRRGVENEYKVRRLPIDWMWADISEWITQYATMGIDDLRKVPLCACGCRKTPKRCTGSEIKAFLQGLLDRNVEERIELRPAKTKKTVVLAEKRYHVRPVVLHATFLASGYDILAHAPLSARYILGQPPETVDERVYIDFTASCRQQEMNEMIGEIMKKMGFGGDA